MENAKFIMEESWKKRMEFIHVYKICVETLTALSIPVYVLYRKCIVPVHGYVLYRYMYCTGICIVPVYVVYRYM